MCDGKTVAAQSRVVNQLRACCRVEVDDDQGAGWKTGLWQSRIDNNQQRSILQLRQQAGGRQAGPGKQSDVFGLQFRP